MSTKYMLHTGYVSSRVCSKSQFVHERHIGIWVTWVTRLNFQVMLSLSLNYDKLRKIQIINSCLKVFLCVCFFFFCLKVFKKKFSIIVQVRNSYEIYLCVWQHVAVLRSAVMPCVKLLTNPRVTTVLPSSSSFTLCLIHCHTWAKKRRSGGQFKSTCNAISYSFNRNVPPTWDREISAVAESSTCPLKKKCPLPETQSHRHSEICPRVSDSTVLHVH